jgi:putative ABC transport system permease protein
MPVANVATMEDVLSESIAQPRFNTFVLGLFGVTALVLAAIGVYGLLAFTLSRRTHEIGIRMALGAERRDVLRLVVKQGLFLTLVGLALGLAGAVGMTRVLESLLFGVSYTDPSIFLSVTFFVTLVALLASYLPARRAGRVDCVTALRYE